MDNVTNKALVIAVGVFITIAITSGILLSINEMKNVYSKVYETDINIKNDFSEFDAYDNTEKTGLDIANALNKYTSDNYSTYVHITVRDPAPSINNNSSVDFWLDEDKIKDYDEIYSYRYDSTVTIDDNEQVYITFKRK